MRLKIIRFGKVEFDQTLSMPGPSLEVAFENPETEYSMEKTIDLLIHYPDGTKENVPFPASALKGDLSASDPIPDRIVIDRRGLAETGAPPLSEMNSDQLADMITGVLPS